MPLITFITPDSLAQKEFNALREHRFKLHCLEMKLEPFGEEGMVFSGPGAIEQTPDGKLHFTLFAKEKVSIQELFQQRFGDAKIPAGSIIPKEEFYRLSVHDQKGRRWICKQVSPNIDSTSEKGTICTGYLTEITYTNNEHYLCRFLV